MVASASGYGTLRRFLSAPEGQPETGQTGIVPGASIAVSVSCWLHRALLCCSTESYAIGMLICARRMVRCDASLRCVREHFNHNAICLISA